MNKAVMAKTAFAAVLIPMLLVPISMGIARTALAQEKKPGPAATILEGWNEIGNKLVAMAEDWPADKYDYRPNTQVRTFAEHLLHAAGSNYYPINRAMGKKEQPDENPSRNTYKSKEQIVAYMKKSVEDGAATIQKIGDQGVSNDLGDWVGIIEHMGEHYGQLVVYYRNNGTVPPASRPKK